MKKTNKLDATNNYGDSEYSGVPKRLKRFREDTVRGDVNTSHTFLPDGGLTFQATVVKDRSDEYSARSTGTAYYNAEEMSKKKAFEKLETISVGRALSLLGYLNNGEIASTEEMEEFNKYQDEKRETAIQIAVEKMSRATNQKELKEAFVSDISLVSEERVVKFKDEMKGKLPDES
jgi:hypothetical protein